MKIEILWFRFLVQTDIHENVSVCVAFAFWLEGKKREEGEKRKVLFVGDHCCYALCIATESWSIFYIYVKNVKICYFVLKHC